MPTNKQGCLRARRFSQYLKRPTFQESPLSPQVLHHSKAQTSTDHTPMSYCGGQHTNKSTVDDTTRLNKSVAAQLEMLH